MRKRLIWCFAVLLLGAAATASAGTATHNPIYTDAQHVGAAALQPPPVCCVPVAPPVAGEPAPVNMAYFGGHIQVVPKIYLIFSG